MTDEIKARIAKIYQLVQQGATEGEKQAAQNALNRLMAKHNLDASSVENIGIQEHAFSYSTDMEHWLLAKLMVYFMGKDVMNKAYRRFWDPEHMKPCRQVVLPLPYQDYVTLDCAYEYFRRHMKAQWKKTCEPAVKACRKTKTRNTKRKELQNVFFDQYIIASNLVDTTKLVPLNMDDLSKAEIEKLRRLQGLQGGSYSTQVQTAHMLESHTPEVTANKYGQITMF